MTWWKHKNYAFQFFSAVLMTVLAFNGSSALLRAQAQQNNTTPAAANNSNASQNQQENAKENIEGFNGVAWGEAYNQTLERMKAVASSGERPQFTIVNAIKNKEIVVREGDILYRYVFYLNPVLQAQDPHNLKTDMEAEQNQEPQGKFFFAAINFPPILAESIYQVLQARYGDRSLSTSGQDKNGAYIWQKETGYIAQWIMQYEKAPYTRTVYYLSREISSEIAKDFQTYMFQEELKVLKDLKP